MIFAMGGFPPLTLYRWRRGDTPGAWRNTLQVIRYIFIGLQILSAIAMVVVVAMQTTKNEGLSGSIGGQVASTGSSKVRMSSEERLREITKTIAIAFLILSAIIALPQLGPPS